MFVCWALAERLAVKVPLCFALPFSCFQRGESFWARDAFIFPSRLVYFVSFAFQVPSSPGLWVVSSSPCFFVWTGFHLMILRVLRACEPSVLFCR